MHVKGNSSQIKIRTLESMINEKGELFFGGKEKKLNECFHFPFIGHQA
jgi:hypothetical protein